MGYQGSSWNPERLQEVYVVLLPSPAQSRLQARRLWEPSMATTAPLSSLICVDTTCRIFSILSICPTSISIHPPLQRPKNALCKFQWDRSLLCMQNLPKGLPALGNKAPNPQGPA